jgi:hypothetical protein
MSCRSEPCDRQISGLWTAQGAAVNAQPMRKFPKRKVSASLIESASIGPSPECRSAHPGYACCPIRPSAISLSFNIPIKVA